MTAAASMACAASAAHAWPKTERGGFGPSRPVMAVPFRAGQADPPAARYARPLRADPPVGRRIDGVRAEQHDRGKDGDHVEGGQYPGQDAAGHPLGEQGAALVLNAGHDMVSLAAPYAVSHSAQSSRHPK